MKLQLWKNVISDNLKNAILEEVEEHLNQEVKEIRGANTRLLNDNKHKLQLIKRLKKTLALSQGVEVHKINIIKEVL